MPILTYLSASRPRGSNYTPRDIMLQVASEQPHIARPVYGKYGALLLSVQGDLFAYDHWIITQSSANPNLESITLCLKGVDKP